MRKFSVGFGMMALATSIAGCAVDDELAWRKGGQGGGETGTTAQAETTNVQGHISTDGNGNAATGLAGKNVLDGAANVTVSKLGDNGALTQLGKGNIGAGGLFNIPIPTDNVPGTLIVQVINVGGAVLGSAVLNGIPAFFKGFVFDATIDTATSFKTEVLMTMSKKGVPGVQNYLNVVNTFVDAYLSGGIAVAGAFTSDFNAIFGAMAEAVVATENAIVASLNKAGIPVDITSITDSQIAAVSGIRSKVSTSNGKLVSDSKNLVAMLQEATAKAAAPVDKAIYNAIVAGSATFNSKFKSAMPGAQAAGNADGQGDFAFGVLKSMARLQSEVARDGIEDVFGKAGTDAAALAMVSQAGVDFTAQLEQAKDVKGLADAKAAFKAALLGKEEGDQKSSVLEKIATVVNQLKAALRNVNAVVEPLTEKLASALGAGQLSNEAIQNALAEFDGGAKDLASKLTGVTKGQDAEALAEAVKIASKLFGK